MKWPVDPRNPGEVFACAGLAHLVWRTNPEWQTGFVFEDRCHFIAPDLSTPFCELAGASLEKTKDGLRIADVALDWWREWGLNPELKTWAGQQSAWSVHNNLLCAAEGSEPDDWLIVTAPTSGRLNVDALGSWNALSMGWSPNEHGHVKMLCRPWLELLASIGLQVFPVRGRKSEAGFVYNLWRPASLSGAVAAFGSRKPTVYSLQQFRTATGKSGSNTMLTTAHPNPEGAAPPP